MTAGRARTAVLISGRGSNLAALIEATAEPDYPAEIVLVVSDRADAAGLTHASEHGTPTAVVERSAYATKADFEAALNAALDAARVELVCLAGFMRLLSAECIERWRDRMLNIHPSLLPAFPGLRTHERALAAGVKIHGATVHFVRAETDSGPIVAQAAVPVLAGDTPASLAGRVLAAEHRLYPLALQLVASELAKVVDERVEIAGIKAGDLPPLFSPPV